MVFSISAIFPIVAAILNVLAARGALVEGMTLQTAERVLKSKKKRR
jgi:hypothetical protein